MKKILFILIGITIGSLTTIGFQAIRKRLKPSYVVAKDIKKNMGATNVKDLSTDELLIHDVDGSFLQIVSVKHPDIFLGIYFRDGGVNQLTVHDKNNTFASFMDKDADGIWDFRDFSNNDITYSYGRGTGYPDTIMNKKNSNVVVRVDDQYYEMLRKNGLRYVKINGDLVEIQSQKWGYFQIK